MKIDEIKNWLVRITGVLMNLVEIPVFVIIAQFYKNNPKYNDIWLISERETEAKDNGYCLFKYIREYKKDINISYIMDKKYKNEYEKVNMVGNVIQYKSFEHKVAFILCNTLLSTHLGKVCPWNYRVYKLIFDIRNRKKFIFLQHGITQNDVSDILGPHSRIDLFICGAYPEYQYIKEVFGYNKNQVVYTGFARFDNLHEGNVKKQILVMPTWRKNIVSTQSSKNKAVGDEVFLESEYYKLYNSLINNSRLINTLNKLDYKLIFYPHYEIQQYLKYFSSNSENVIIASKDKYDVQSLLKESCLLVTDFSSVFFDFAYMKKPIIYYQFDKTDFFNNHYKKGYFNCDNDGFGPVIETEELLIDKIINYINSDLEIETEYKCRADKFFPLHDKGNCERIFQEICKYINRSEK